MKQPEEQKKTAKRYVTLSFAAHASLFLFFMIGGIACPQKSLVVNPSVQIDMVALPNQVKQENPEPIDPTLKVKENPPPPPEEKQPDEPEPAPIKAPPPAKEKDAAKEAKSALERLREQVKKNEKKQEAENRKKQQEQLEKRKEDLKRFDEAYRNAISGNQTHKGTSSTGDMSETLNAYGGHIIEVIRSNWGLPAFLQGKGLRASVIIKIGASGGSAAQITFLQRSGNTAFDEYVEAAVKRSKFAPPPEELARSLRNTGVEVNFPL